MRLPKIFDHDIITDGLILLPNPMFWLDFTAKSLISTALKILLPQTPNFAKPHFWIFSPIWQSFSPVPLKFLKSPQEFTHYFGPIRAHLVCSPNTSCIWLPVSVSVCFTETYMYHWFLPPPMANGLFDKYQLWSDLTRSFSPILLLEGQKLFDPYLPSPSASMLFPSHRGLIPTWT